MKNHNYFVEEVKKEIDRQFSETKNLSDFSNNNCYEYFDYTDTNVYKDEESVYFNVLAEFIFSKDNELNHLFRSEKIIDSTDLNLFITYSKNVKSVNFSILGADDEFRIFFRLDYDEKTKKISTISYLENIDISNFCTETALYLFSKVAKNYKLLHIEEKELCFLKEHNLLDSYLNSEEEAINILYLNFENPAVIDSKQDIISRDILKSIENINNTRKKTLTL